MKARQKINEGTDFRKEVPVPMGDEDVKLTHSLLPENELLRIQAEIDQEALMEHQSDGESEEQAELRELQKKDDEDLTEEDEKRMAALQEEVSRQQAGLMNSLGYDTFKAFCVVGKRCLEPTEGDIEDAFDLTTAEQNEFYGEELTTRDRARELVKEDMVEMVEDQPYPIKFIVGQSAYTESMKLFGDADEEELEGN